mmetsp:Transcript_9851/g.36079  ORF Transcript_9851/g.36079 Transcript_9851/m.36079 type:complete len:407 (+) Transcript_9851:130-1350(+)
MLPVGLALLFTLLRSARAGVQGIPVPDAAFDVKLMIHTNENSQTVKASMTNTVPVLFIEFRLTDDTSPDEPNMNSCSDFLEVDDVSVSSALDDIGFIAVLAGVPTCVVTIIGGQSNTDPIPESTDIDIAFVTLEEFPVGLVCPSNTQFITEDGVLGEGDVSLECLPMSFIPEIPDASMPSPSLPIPAPQIPMPMPQPEQPSLPPPFIAPPPSPSFASPPLFQPPLLTPPPALTSPPSLTPPEASDSLVLFDPEDLPNINIEVTEIDQPLVTIFLLHAQNMASARPLQGTPVQSDSLRVTLPPFGIVRVSLKSPTKLVSTTAEIFPEVVSMASSTTLLFRAYTTSAKANTFISEITANFASTGGFNEFASFTLPVSSSLPIRTIEFWNNSLQTQIFFLGRILGGLAS